MYDKFARIYDQVMRGVDYPGWAEYVLNLAVKYGFDSSRLCDLACGTGSLALRLAAKGSEVLGIDRSATMLEEARRKARQAGASRLRWLEADMTDFHLAERFPLITCLYDSVNYLLSEEAVGRCFERAGEHLEPAGGFIFDITTEYNIVANFADYTFAENFEDFSYIWENKYNILSKVITSDVTLFQKRGDRFHKFVETHRQKIYPVDRIERLVRQAGFELLGTFDGFTLNAPGPKVERVHFVCRLQKE